LEASMKIEYVLSKKDKTMIYLNQHYSNGFWGLVRLLGGPLLLVFGIIVFLFSEGLGRYVGIFSVMFGAYYGLRPLFSLLSESKEISDEHGFLSISRYGTLTVKDDNTETDVKKEYIKTYSLTKKYLIIRIFTSRSFLIQIPLECIAGGNLKEFIAVLRNFAEKR
jgi:hypothetical protein